MIHRIGVLCQDRNSFGFLVGLKRRLDCAAELIEPTTGGLSKSTTMTRKQAKLAIADLDKKGVDLILRFTDADRNRWQDIRRHENGVFAREIVCGVAVENTEQWLALDRGYLEKELGVPVTVPEPSDAIKSAIARRRQPDEPVWEVTARLVAHAPAQVFHSWLKIDEALRDFYQECRRAALRADCEVPNELD